MDRAFSWDLLRAFSWDVVRATFLHPFSGVSEIIHDEPDLTRGEVFLTLEVAVELAQLVGELGAIVNPSAERPHGFHRRLVGEVLKG